MRFVDTEASKKEYKEFLESHERCNFQQSLEWAEVKKPYWLSLIHILGSSPIATTMFFTAR